jgi:hypothetical protein
MSKSQSLLTIHVIYHKLFCAIIKKSNEHRIGPNPKWSSFFGGSQWVGASRRSSVSATRDSQTEIFQDVEAVSCRCRLFSRLSCATQSWLVINDSSYLEHPNAWPICSLRAVCIFRRSCSIFMPFFKRPSICLNGVMYMWAAQASTRQRHGRRGDWPFLRDWQLLRRSPPWWHIDERFRERTQPWRFSW